VHTTCSTLDQAGIKAISPSSSCNKVYENSSIFQVFVQYFTNKKSYYPILKNVLIFMDVPFTATTIDVQCASGFHE